MTIDGVQLFYFDRAGAVHTETIDIHQDAVTFVTLIRFLANPDLSTLGFDPKVYWDGTQRQMDILSGDRIIKYDVDRVLFHHSVMFGAGTTCWVAREAETRKEVVIKDKWCGEDCDSEADLLIAAGEAAIAGVACLLAVDETFAAEKHLTTSSLRQRQGLETTADNNQAFCRIVLDLCAPTIQHFRSGLQLVQAFRDSIQSRLFPFFVASSLTRHILAHYDLVKVGILHRDISADTFVWAPRMLPQANVRC